MSGLLELAGRCERYVPSGHYDLDKERERELNEAIGLSIGVGHRVKVGDPALGNDRWVPSPLKPYVTSLDAAMTLIASNTLYAFGSMEDGPFARLLRPMPDGGYLDGYIGVSAATVPLALCAAALRARHHTKSGEA